MSHTPSFRFIAPALALALAGALTWSTPTRADEPQPAPQQEEATTQQSTTTVVGLRVVIDPETMQPIAVHSDHKVEGSQLSPAMLDLLNTRVTPITIERVNGVKRADLGLSALVPLVVSLDADGQVKVDHVDIEDEATPARTETTEEAGHEAP